MRLTRLFNSIRLVSALLGVTLVTLPSAASAIDATRYNQLQTPFYNPNATNCGNGFLGTGPLFGPNFPTAIDSAALKNGITNFIKSNHPDSPLLPLVDTIINVGQQTNANPAMVVAMAQKETQLGTVGNGTAGGGYNITNIRGGSSFAKYGSYQEGIAATYDNLNTSLYLLPPASDTTVAEVINTWAPPTENDTNGYIGFVGGAMGFMLGGNPTSDGTDICTSGTGGNGQVDNSDEATLAKKILASSQYHCDNPGDCADLQAMASGQSLKGVGDCQVDKLNIEVLQLLAYLLDNNFQIGTFALCSDHSDDGINGHVGGNAVDISTVNGAAIAANIPAAGAAGLKLDQFLNNIPAQILPNQQISYGYGGHYDASMAALQMYDGKLCVNAIPNCETYYTTDTEKQHENHIHVGYKSG